MSRLIDADALMELVQKTHCTGCNNYNKVKCRACEIGDMLDYLDDAPTVDPWHYPSEGELPEKDGEYFITVKIEGGGFLNALAIYHVDRGWLGIFNKPYAWQYIVPPKEEA